MTERVYDIDINDGGPVNVSIRNLSHALGSLPAAFAAVLSDLFNSGGWGRREAQAVAKYFLREHRCLQANLVLFCTQLVVSFYEQYVTEWTRGTRLESSDLDSIDLNMVCDPRNQYALEVARKVSQAVRQDI